MGEFMSWAKVGDFIKGSLPILGTALGGPAGTIAGTLLSKALGVNDDSEEVLTALADPNAILKYKLADLEVNRDILVASFRAQEVTIQAVNETMRSEHNSHDAFVRRWRPFFGYSMSVTWFIQMTGFTFVFVYVAVSAPNSLPALVQQFALLSGSLLTLWGVALSVLGVSVYKRSQDKLTVAESKAKGFLAKFISK